MKFLLKLDVIMGGLETSRFRRSGYRLECTSPNAHLTSASASSLQLFQASMSIATHAASGRGQPCKSQSLPLPCLPA
eukprot:scaffold28431_cov34-Prasinocladus_malaysianus.AAC.2